MALADAARAERLLRRVPQVQQPQRIGDGDAALPQAPRQLLLRNIAPAQHGLQRLGHLQGCRSLRCRFSISDTSYPDRPRGARPGRGRCAPRRAARRASAARRPRSGSARRAATRRQAMAPPGAAARRHGARWVAPALERLLVELPARLLSIGPHVVDRRLDQQPRRPFRHQDLPTACWRARMARACSACDRISGVANRR